MGHLLKDDEAGDGDESDDKITDITARVPESAKRKKKRGDH
jgi:hypothetical protein